MGIIGTLSVIIGAVFTIDNRYAHSDELSKFKIEQQQVIQQNRTDLMNTSNFIRKQSLEDKIFELELVAEAKRSDYDRAKLNKYKRDLEDLNVSLRAQNFNNKASTF